MRRMALFAGIGLAMIGLAAAGASAAGASRGSRTLVLVQSPPEVAFVDLGDPGPTPGDVLVFQSELFDSASAPVGDLNITCTQGIGPENICRGIISLTGRGQLSVDALPTFPLPTVGIVNGGNGEFERTRGEVHIEPQPDRTTLLTFHLFG